MEITLTEALRIKNDLSNTIKTINYSVNQASFGKTTEDGEVVSQDVEKFEVVEASLIKGLSISEELHNTISDFNKTSSVDKIVRKMQNAKLLLEVYSRNLDKTKPKQNKRFENLGTVRKSVEMVYTPSITSKDMKAKITEQKSIVRDLQSQVEKLNQLKINVSFEYSDIENLIG